jgi:cellulose biosynthesis protein BcsE
MRKRRTPEGLPNGSPDGLPNGSEGRPHFRLGLAQAPAHIDALRCPGFYAVLADTQPQAERLGLGLLHAQNEDTACDWLAPGRRARDIAAALPRAQGPRTLTQWALPGDHLRDALAALPEDFSGVRRRRGAPRLIVLEVPVEALEAFKTRSLRRWCWRWHLWLAERGICLLLLAHGARALTLRERLETHSDALDGLMHLQASGGDTQCHLLYWRSDRGACGVDELHLVADEPGWRCISEPAMPTRGSSDEHVLLVQGAALENAPPLSGDWRTFSSREEVLAAAQRALAATVVLGVARSADVEPLARALHALRRSRGGALKLVVRELAPCLRYRDERLLTLCGASMIVRRDVPFSHFLNRLEAVQGQRFSRPVVEDVNVLIEAVHHGSASGRCSPAQFATQIREWLESESATLMASLLVALEPAGDLSVEQAMAQCRLHRQGDAMTLMEGRLYLFLFGCRRSDADQALERLFGLPVTALFGARQLFDASEAIAVELERLTRLGWTRQQALPALPAEAEAALEDGATTPRPQAPRPAPLKLALEE